MSFLDPGILFAATATGGGLWLVVRLVIRYQRDFTDRYAERLKQQDEQIATLRREVDDLKRRLISCHVERGAMLAVLRQNGIDWDPSFLKGFDG